MSDLITTLTQSALTKRTIRSNPRYRLLVAMHYRGEFNLQRVHDGQQDFAPERPARPNWQSTLGQHPNGVVLV